jgi:ABC-type molybdenum transport system ATPase subunit/photorepair protein PhrA
MERSETLYSDPALLAEARAALDAIDKLIDLIDCTDKHNLSLLPLFLAQQKLALAALARMKQPHDHAALLTEAVKALEPFARQNLNEMASDDVNRARYVLIRLRAAVDARMEQP